MVKEKPGATKVGLKPGNGWHRRNFFTEVWLPSIFTKRAGRHAKPEWPQLKDDEIVEVAPLDAIRIAPGVTRALEADGDGLEYLAFGPAHKGDGELVHEGFWDQEGTRP